MEHDREQQTHNKGRDSETQVPLTQTSPAIFTGLFICDYRNKPHERGAWITVA